MKRLHLIPDHFYRFYSIGDVIKGAILLVVLHVAMLPFILWAIDFIVLGHSYTFAIILSGISLINIGYYIKAVICYFLDVKKMKYLKEHNLLPDPNVDIVWQVRNPY